MNRYFVFAYPDYYPAGGMGDFEKSFHNVGDAVSYADSLSYQEYVQVWDMETEKEIYSVDIGWIREDRK